MNWPDALEILSKGAKVRRVSFDPRVYYLILVTKENYDALVEAKRDLYAVWLVNPGAIAFVTEPDADHCTVHFYSRPDCPHFLDSSSPENETATDWEEVT